MNHLTHSWYPGPYGEPMYPAFEREEDASYIKCSSEGDCDEEVEHEGDLCPSCLSLQVKEDAFQVTR